ncbi:MAG: DUF2235 domain-containing protein [Hyphomonadaceae bacterium]|nr:DUF2235 domain-containing protein [Hyphomonadaceae bacterium]
MKRIIVCMDGTWQSLNQPKLTNIGILARSIAHRQTRPDGSQVHQIVIYTHGVGSSMGALSRRSLLEVASESFARLTGGALGAGLEDGILDTYLRLAFNYEDGDEIYIFGFSRGAFAARRLAGMINTAGIVSRRHVDRAREGFRLYYSKPHHDAPEQERLEHAAKAAEFRREYGKGRRNADGTRLKTDDVQRITYLGVFDTVAQRGASDVVASFMPWNDPQRFKFRSYRVCDNVLFARHAVAIDESRLGFPVMLWDNLEEANARRGQRAYLQRWFVGTHGDVGGGEGSPLAAAALKWIAEGASEAGLRFYATYGADTSPLDDALAEAGLVFDRAITRPTLVKALQPINYPLRARKIWSSKARPSLADAEAILDASVMRRMTAKLKPRYRPSALRPFQKALKDWRPPAE